MGPRRSLELDSILSAIDNLDGMVLICFIKGDFRHDTTDVNIGYYYESTE